MAAPKKMTPPNKSKKQQLGNQLAKQLKNNNPINEIKSIPGNAKNTAKSWAGTTIRTVAPPLRLLNVNKKGISIKPKNEIARSFVTDAVNYGTAAANTARTKGVGGFVKNDTYMAGRRVAHGSPQTITGFVKPRAGSAMRPSEKVLFTWDPKKFGDRQILANAASEYAGKTGQPGKIYTGKVKRRDIVHSGDGTVVSKGPMLISNVFNQNDPKLAKKLDRALNKPAGLGKPADVRKKQKQAQQSIKKIKNNNKKNKKNRNPDDEGA